MQIEQILRNRTYLSLGLGLVNVTGTLEHVADERGDLHGGDVGACDVVVGLLEGLGEGAEGLERETGDGVGQHGGGLGAVRGLRGERLRGQHAHGHALDLVGVELGQRDAGGGAGLGDGGERHGLGADEAGRRGGGGKGGDKRGHNLDVRGEARRRQQRADVLVEERDERLDDLRTHGGAALEEGNHAQSKHAAGADAAHGVVGREGVGERAEVVLDLDGRKALLTRLVELLDRRRVELDVNVVAHDDGDKLIGRNLTLAKTNFAQLDAGLSRSHCIRYVYVRLSNTKKHLAEP